MASTHPQDCVRLRSSYETAFSIRCHVLSFFCRRRVFLCGWQYVLSPTDPDNAKEVRDWFDVLATVVRITRDGAIYTINFAEISSFFSENRSPMAHFSETMQPFCEEGRLQTRHVYKLYPAYRAVRSNGLFFISSLNFSKIWAPPSGEPPVNSRRI